MSAEKDGFNGQVEPEKTAIPTSKDPAWLAGAVALAPIGPGVRFADEPRDYDVSDGLLLGDVIEVVEGL